MMKPLIQFVLLLSVVSGLGVSVQGAVTDTQPSGTSQSVSAANTTSAKKPAKLTPEQEAALVEVQKILGEAWEVASSIVPPSKPPEYHPTQLEQYRNKLLWNIEEARFRAGDFATAPTTKQSWELVLGQLRYGHLQEAVRTATDAPFPTDQTLVILKMLSDEGDFAGSLKVAEEQTRPGKNFGGSERRQQEAELLAYVARRQAQAKKPEAPKTLRDAQYAVGTNKDIPQFQYGGAAAVGCAQAVFGDQVASTASFRQAIQAAEAIKREEYQGHRVAALSLVGRAAAQSGSKAASQEAFKNALRLASQMPEYKAQVDAIGNLAIIQFLSGDRVGGMESFQEALKFSESLSSSEQRRSALSSVVEHQIIAGERAAAQATLERMRRGAEALADPKERAADLESVMWWEAKLMTPQLALERAQAIHGDDEKQAGALASAAYWIVHRKEVSTPDVLHHLSKMAASLLAKPLPNDRKRADQYLGNLARVQAVAGEASQALQIAGRISDSNSQKDNYLELIFLLAKNGDIDGAKNILTVLSVRDEEMPWGDSGKTRGDAFRKLATTQVARGDRSGALAWARQQKSLYGRAESLVGVALGILEQQGIRELDHDIPRIRWLMVKGPIDKLAISCDAL